MRSIGTTLLAAAILGILADFPAATADTNHPVAELEGLIGQWVDLRAQIAAEKRSWEDRRGQLETEIALLEKEQAALRTEVDSAVKLEETVAESRLDQVTRKEELEAVVGRMAPFLDRAEAELRAWPDRIPGPLAAPLRDAFGRLPDTHEHARRKSVTSRCQLVLALFSQIEQLQHGIHVTREILPQADGQRQEMEVIYLGLARGFAVSADGLWAAVGQPGADGWQWQPRPEIAADVRAVVEVYERRRTAQLVPLPLQSHDPK